ncbi:hemin receptor [Nocardioides marmoriginsengisoli]|uniref:Hemin receptor n=1 Tax=Nocardioides marmoriginsengisoli TaxID=661483 RepID=A0A3N0CHQ7_9ACTN|nr:ABC transporter substrate-binding protein [Nocardioides marmoriginsengisoli]RNL62997.1 hemin receptor [Nocardioides marmoriginsengisoli]
MRNRGSGITRFVLVGLVLTVLAACGTATQGHGDGDEVAAPTLANVKPLADPKTWTGVAHAGLPPVAIDPVTDDPAPKLPVTVTDSQGTKVTVTDTSRILALDIYGTLAQTVFELGLGDSVVGRDLSTQFPEARDLPMVTSDKGHDLIAEQILATNPSVILTDTSLGPWDVILQMRDSGIPVVVVDSKRSLDNLASLTEEVATALGVPAEGKKLGARIQADAKATAAQIAEVAPTALEDKLRMVFLYVRGQAGVYYMFGEGSGADSLIETLGGYDVAAEIDWSGMKPVTDEAIVAAQPDLILMMTKGLESVGGIDGLLDRIPAIANTPAGQNKRIVDMVDTGILSYGPRTAEVLNSLAVAVYAPEALQ